MNPDSNIIEQFFSEQIKDWPQASNNYSFLVNVQEKRLHVEGMDVLVQYNPARIFSSSAKVDTESIKERPCFLCPDIRPAKQKSLDLVMSSGHEYELLVNPFPIFPKHFTIPSKEHTPQDISSRFGDMLEIVDIMTDYMVFYNGAQCGASAPDHFHFQAGMRGYLPIDCNCHSLDYVTLADSEELTVRVYKQYFRGTVSIKSSSAELLKETFALIYDKVKAVSGTDTEPMFNILAKKDADIYSVLIINRKAHRPECYYREDEGRILISPGAVDMGGIMVLPLKEDFDKITEFDICKVLEDVTFTDEQTDEMLAVLRPHFMRKQRSLEVGILSDTLINVHFDGDYYHNYYKCSSSETFRFRNGMIDWNGHNFKQIELRPESEASGSFVLDNVIIGNDFHWQQARTQRYRGGIRLVAESNSVRLINVIGIEDYLLSVISSEMNASASHEFLKAHAVISRSWVLHLLEQKNSEKKQESYIQTGDNEYTRWYGHEQHKGFDVCADDHCQRYQGLPDVVPETLRSVIDETWGEVLTYGGKVCDARFSKCCGGVSEMFSTCWEDEDVPYLTPVRDSSKGFETSLSNTMTADLSNESEFEKWVTSVPDSFCNVQGHDAADLLSKILNDYDKETESFYRWKVEYTQDGLSEIVKNKTGRDIGRILSIVPLERGVSGRLKKIRIEGEKSFLTVGKELEIRRILSESHLLSSAFSVKKESGKFIFYGAGWGHGVGLCQIGAAVMGEKGYTYRQILSHYYRGTEIKKIWW